MKTCKTWKVSNFFPTEETDYYTNKITVRGLAITKSEQSVSCSLLIVSSRGFMPMSASHLQQVATMVGTPAVAVDHSICVSAIILEDLEGFMFEGRGDAGGFTGTFTEDSLFRKNP